MSLRLRLFILIGGLVALLVLAQWWWTRALAQDLSSEIDEVASSVGHSVATFFRDVDLHGVAVSPHARMVECLGEDCDVKILEDTILKDVNDVDVVRQRFEARVEGEDADGEAQKARVMIQKFQRQEVE